MDFTTCVQQRVPPKWIIYPKSDENIEKTLQSVLPHNPFYVKKVIGKLIQDAENEGEAPEMLYEMYCWPQVLEAKELNPTDIDTVAYKVGSAQIWIQETPRLISGMGTTGLRTWEASLFLSEYLVHEACWANKNVLELGCGTGLVGISLLKNKLCKTVIFTDGDVGVVEKMSNILSYNGVNGQAQRLLWGESDVPFVDILVAADVTYDISVLPSLRGTLECAFLKGCKQILIAATVRNEDTILAWEQELTKYFRWNIIASKNHSGSINLQCWYPPETPDIKIYSIESI